MIVITLPDAAAADLRRELAAHTAAEVAAGCEPSGYRINVAVDPIDGATATLELGARRLPLGRVEIA